jgi:pimeloyl-ACP methyl ester carboxylesterase
MVAYAYAATYPDKVERLVVMDAPIPGIGPWSEIPQRRPRLRDIYWVPEAPDSFKLEERYISMEGSEVKVTGLRLNDYPEASVFDTTVAQPLDCFYFDLNKARIETVQSQD